MALKNLIDKELRAQWARKKWEFMEIMQEQEPRIWFGWYALTVIAAVSPNGGMYNHE